jgi:hypothetical protein
MATDNKSKKSYSKNYSKSNYTYQAPKNLIYFALCQTKQQLKLEFRKLAKLNHADMFQDADEKNKQDAIFIAIKKEYEMLKSILPNEVISENEPEQTEEEFQKQASYAYRSHLTAYNFIWSPEKVMYYWHLEKDGSKWHGKTKDIDTIRTTHGTTKVNNNFRPTLK